MKQIIRRVALWIMCISVVAVSLVGCKARFEYEERQRGHWVLNTDGKTMRCEASGDECWVGAKQAAIEVDFGGPAD